MLLQRQMAAVFHQLRQRGFRIMHKCLIHGEFCHAHGRQFIFEFTEKTLQNRHQAASSRLLFIRLHGDFMKAGHIDVQFDAISCEIFAILRQHAVFGPRQNLLQIRHAQIVQRDTHRKTPHELRLETEIDQILRRHLRQQLRRFLHVRTVAAMSEANLRAAKTATDLFGQFRERPADDEQNVFRPNGHFRDGTAALQRHHRLHLPQHVVLPHGFDFRVLHQFQQVDLHAAAGHVALHRAVALPRDLVDFVDIDDAVFGQFRIAVGDFHQIADDVLHVVADIACFGKLCRIGLYERDTDQFGDAPHQICLADASRAEHHDVVLREIMLRQFGLLQTTADMVVMVANRDGQHFFRLILADNKTVQIILYLLRLEGEITDFPQRLLMIVLFRRLLAAVRLRPHVPTRHVHSHELAAQPLQSVLQLA